MYPTLYHFFYGVFGIQIEFLKMIPMLGLWIGIAFVAANWFGARELKRRQELGFLQSKTKRIIVGKPANPIDLIINGIIGFILGFKLIPLFTESGIFDDFVGFLMSGRGNIIAGILAGIGMAYWKYREVKKDQLDVPVEKEIEIKAHEQLGNITLIGILGGIGGALIFATLEQPSLISEYFANTSLGIGHLYNGLTVYGGVIVAVIGCLIYFKKNNLNIAQYLDALGPTVLLAYGIGRIGCQLSGDGDWGIDNLTPKPDWMAFLPDWMWAYDYPNNINNEGIEMANSLFPDYNHRLENPVYPTPIYEMLMSFGLFAVLWKLRKRMTIPMMLFSLYVLFTGLERLSIERIRVNVEYGNGLTQAEIISVALIILGVVGLIYFYLRRKNNTEIHNSTE